MPPLVPGPTDEAGPEWTLAVASAYFEAGGLPISEARLAVIVKALRDQSGRTRLNPAGRSPSGERGGVGKATYHARELMELHRDLARWLTPPLAPQTTPRARRLLTRRG
jgi:hypothetical protein